MKSLWRRRIEQSLIAALAWLTSLAVRFVSFRGLYLLADALANLIILLVPRRIRMAERNIAATFPHLSPQECRAICRRSVKNIVRTMLEHFKLPYLSAQDLKHLLTGSDLQPMKQALQEGSSVILISAHLGNWEYLGAYASSQVAPLTVIARDAAHPVVAGLINKARQAHKITVLGREDLREMLRVLNAGGMLGILPDQHCAQGGALLEFLGRPAWTFTGPALLAQRSNARVFAAFCVRHFDSGALEVILWPEIELIHTGQRTQDVIVNTQRINKAIEEAIRAYPDNWLWLHNRWKSKRLAPQAPSWESSGQAESVQGNVDS